jgi:lipoprotein-anchoring transpeptidase ErfK/SrfK
MLAAGEKVIFVNLDTQRLTAYEGHEALFGGPISSGKEGHETPTGRYRVLQKERIHRSNLWPKPDGGAMMPYMLRITWDGIALHQGSVSRRPASHGCVRVPEKLARRLYRWADVGTRVLIGGDIYRFNDGVEDTIEVVQTTRNDRSRIDADGYAIIDLYE